MAVNNIYNSGIANNSNTPKAQFDATRAKIASEEIVKTSLEGKDALVKSKTDSVTITEQAQSFKEIQKKAKDAPEINQQKVADIKKAIMDGSYTIDSVTIANKMVDFEQELDFLYN